MKKYIIFIIFFILVTITTNAQKIYPKIVIETNFGNMIVELYEETPLHSDNFVKLVKEGYYNEQLFHRVINNFMIQAGDPKSKNAPYGVRLGSGGPDYTIPAEFFPEYFHKKGALAAARQGDNINPNKESSGSQFYIVQGKKFTIEELNAWVKQGSHIPFSQKQINDYTSIGGTPHLDYSYTVFGEITEGLDILDLIASSPVDKNNRPLEDIKIVNMYTKSK